MRTSCSQGLCFQDSCPVQQDPSGREMSSGTGWMRMLSAFSIHASAAGVGTDRTSTTRSSLPRPLLFFNRTSSSSKRKAPCTHGDAEGQRLEQFLKSRLHVIQECFIRPWRLSWVQPWRVPALNQPSPHPVVDCFRQRFLLLLSQRFSLEFLSDFSPQSLHFLALRLPDQQVLESCLTAGVAGSGSLNLRRAGQLEQMNGLCGQVRG